MSSMTRVGRVMVPVADQAAAISTCAGRSDFELTAGTPLGRSGWWVQGAPATRGTALARRTSLLVAARARAREMLS